MTRRSAAPLSLLAIGTLALAVAPSVAAKEGTQARLDTPIPADTPPGATIDVGWTTFQADGQGGKVIAFSGAPVFIALRSPDAVEPESLVFGDEAPTGSGHFTASIVVPAGGIAPDGVTVGLRGETCQDGQCVSSAMIFELVGEVLTTLPVAPAAPVAPAGSAPAAVALGQGPEPATGPTLWLGPALAGASIVTVIAAGAAGFTTRRRPSDTGSPAIDGSARVAAPIRAEAPPHGPRARSSLRQPGPPWRPR